MSSNRGRMTLSYVKDCMKKKETDEIIGMRLGISRQAVYQFRKRFGLSRVQGRKLERNKEMLRMSREGCRLRVIAEKFDLTISTAGRVCASV